MMARDTRPARDVRNEVDEGRLKKKLNARKDGAHCSSSKTVDISGGPQGLHNLNKLEKGNLANPLRRCDGIDTVSSSSSGFKQTVTVSVSEENGRKEKYPKEAVVLGSENSQVGLKRRKVTGRAFRDRFRNMCRVEIVPDIGGKIDSPDELSEDAIIMDNVVDELPGGDGLKHTETILNVKNTICVTYMPARNQSSVKDLDFVDLARSTSLAQNDAKDVDGESEEPGKLPKDSPIVDTDGNEPPDGNVLKDARTGPDSEKSSSSAGTHEGATFITGIEAPQASDSGNQFISVISGRSLKRESESCDSQENDFCSSSAPSVENLVGSSSRNCFKVEEDFGESSKIKERGSLQPNAKSDLEFRLKRKIAETDSMTLNHLESSIFSIEKMCRTRLKKLRIKQQNKLQRFHAIWEEKWLKLEGDHKLQSSFIRSLYDPGPDRENKLKHLDDSFAKKTYEHNLLREAKLKELEAVQLATTETETQRVERWLFEATADYTERKVISMSSLHVEKESCSKLICRRGIEVASPGSSDAAPAEALGCNVHIETSNTDSQNEVVVEWLKPSGDGVFYETQPVKLNKEVVEEVHESVLNGNVFQDTVPPSSEAVGFKIPIKAANDSLTEVMPPSFTRSLLDVVEPLQVPPSETVFDETQLLQLNKEGLEKASENVSEDRVLQLSDKLPGENVLIAGNQQIPDSEVSTRASDDTVMSMRPSYHLQDQDTPATQMQSIVEVTNREHFDIMNSVKNGVAAMVDTATSARSTVKAQDKDAPAEGSRTSLQGEDSGLMGSVDRVDPNAKQSDLHSPAVENQSIPFNGVATFELVDTGPQLRTEALVIVNTEHLDHTPVEVSVQSSAELHEETMLITGNQQISDTEVSTGHMSVEGSLQSSDVLHKENTLVVANQLHVEDSGNHVSAELSPQSSAELHEENVLIENSNVMDIVYPVRSIIELSNRDSPAAENRSATVEEIATLEVADTVNPPLTAESLTILKTRNPVQSIHEHQIPTVENERTEQIEGASPVVNETSTRSNIELQDKNGQAVENPITVQTEKVLMDNNSTVQSSMEHPDRNSPSAECQSASYGEVAMAIVVETVTSPYSRVAPTVLCTLPTIIEPPSMSIVDRENTELIQGVSLVDTLSSLRSDIELQHNDAPVIYNPQSESREVINVVNHVEPIVEQPDQDFPAASNQSASFNEVAGTIASSFITETPSVMNIDQINHGSLEISPIACQHESGHPTRHTSSQSTVICRRVGNAAELSNQAVLHFGPTYVAQSSSQSVPSHLYPTLLPDPLQIEYKNLCRDIEQLKKSHEEKISERKSCYEKALLELRRKYEMELQVDESEYVLRKNELQKYQKKVFWNGMLAEAFRSEGSNIIPTGNPGMQQGQNRPNIIVQHSTGLPYGYSSNFQPHPRPQPVLTTVEQPALVQHLMRPPPISNNIESMVTPAAVQNVQHTHFSSSPQQQYFPGNNWHSFVWQQSHQQAARPPSGPSSSCFQPITSPVEQSQPTPFSQNQQSHQQSARLPYGPSSPRFQPITSPVAQSQPTHFSQNQQSFMQHSVRPPISNVRTAVPPPMHNVQQTPESAPRYSSTPPSRPLVINSHTPVNPHNSNYSAEIRYQPLHLQRAVRPVTANLSSPPHQQAQNACRPDGFPANIVINPSRNAIEMLMDSPQQPCVGGGQIIAPEIRPTSPNDVVCLSDDE